MTRKKTATSKRIPLGRQYKIKAKIREHHRKVRRDAKRNPTNRKKLNKDPGIPNLYPFKDQFVAKLEKMKEDKEVEDEAKKTQRKKNKERNRLISMQQMAEQARAREEEYKMKEQFNSEEKQKNTKSAKGLDVAESSGDSSRRAFYREFKKVIEAADVILEVLDARDPLGCRCPQIERMILSKDPNKKIILVLNKIDMVPVENSQAWLKTLRNEYPTIAFKSSTQKQKRNIGQSRFNATKAGSDLLQTSECLGADNLVQLLKNYTRNLNIKTSISVGVIGYPNVGKSSLINSLKRSKAANVGSTPGLTRSLQEINIDKHVKLIDCPGIVFSTDASDSDLILRNCVKIEQMPDPISPIETILKRCAASKLMSLYRIPAYVNSTEFLSHIARKFGKLGKGGVPNYEMAAIVVLRDWTSGKIPYYTEPPVSTKIHVSAEIVQEWGKVFNLDEIVKTEQSLMRELPKHMLADESEFVSIGVGKLSNDDDMVAGVEEEDDDDDDEEVEYGLGGLEDNLRDEDKKYEENDKKIVKRKRTDGEVNPQTNQEMRKKQNKERKKRRKVENEDDESTTTSSSTFDWNTDFVATNEMQEDDDDNDDQDDDDEDGDDDNLFSVDDYAFPK